MAREGAVMLVTSVKLHGDACGCSVNPIGTIATNLSSARLRPTGLHPKFAAPRLRP
jgi:hypothetical protein